MKKIIHQILLILLVMIIGTLSVFIGNVNADSVAGLNCVHSVNLGTDFTVSLILPSNAYGAEASITVKYSNGSTDTKKLVYVKGMESSGFSNSITFNAKVVGAATVTASNIIISDESSNTIENGGSKVHSMTIVNPNTPAPPNTPDTPTSPTKPETPTNPDTPEQKPTDKPSTTNVNFKTVNETVYTKDSCNVRESYSTSSKKITKLEKGVAVKRTGIGDNGWSKIEYNGQTAYISTQFVTTEKPADSSFKTVNETMYAKQSCNLRKSWSTESEKAGYLDEGEEITRVGIGDNGWSKIKYNGQEVYIATRLLTSEKPEEIEEPDENTVVNENLVTNEIAEGEKTDLELIQEEVGVLPEVGNNIAIHIYEFMVLVAITLSISLVKIYYKSKNEDVENGKNN